MLNVYKASKDHKVDCMIATNMNFMAQERLICFKMC